MYTINIYLAYIFQRENLAVETQTPTFTKNVPLILTNPHNLYSMENLEEWWTKIHLHWPIKEALIVRSIVLLAMRSIWLESNKLLAWRQT